MIDTSGLENWMEADLVSDSGETLKTDGRAFSDATQAVLTSWAPIEAAYVSGGRREELTGAMGAPALHGIALAALCSLVNTAMENLSNELRDLTSKRTKLMADVNEVRLWESTANPDQWGGQDAFNQLLQQQEFNLQGEVDRLATNYQRAVLDAAAAIRAVHADNPDFEKMVTRDGLRDFLTSPFPGSLLTPSISFSLKIFDGKLGFASKDRWALPSNAPSFLNAGWLKWLTKVTTPISWGINYFDSYFDARIQVQMEHPDWSSEQVMNKVLQETAVRGTVRSATGTLVSELASIGAAAATGALIGGAGGTVVLPVIGTVSGAVVGAVAGFIAGVGANMAYRGSGLSSTIAHGSQEFADNVFGENPASFGNYEWAPDPYPGPAKPPVQGPPAPPAPPAPLPTQPPIPSTPTPPSNQLPTPPNTGLPNPYTVKKGDTLWDIAEEYGTTWPKIYEANRQKIDNPDLIYPGQEFTIPVP